MDRVIKKIENYLYDKPLIDVCIYIYIYIYTIFVVEI